MFIEYVNRGNQKYIFMECQNATTMASEHLRRPQTRQWITMIMDQGTRQGFLEDWLMNWICQTTIAKLYNITMEENNSSWVEHNHKWARGQASLN